MNDDELTISVPEAGRRLGLGKNASYEAARRGELPVLRFGRKLSLLSGCWPTPSHRRRQSDGGVRACSRRPRQRHRSRTGRSHH
jgi:hypothetical protein